MSVLQVNDASEPFYLIVRKKVSVATSVFQPSGQHTFKGGKAQPKGTTNPCFGRPYSNIRVIFPGHRAGCLL